MTERDLPIATQLAGVNMKLDRVGVRELRFNMKLDRVGVRWHPNTDEWQYYLDGQARMTMFAAKGDAGGLLPLERQSRARGECGASALMCDSTAVNHQEVPHEH